MKRKYLFVDTVLALETIQIEKKAGISSYRLMKKSD